jgi:hypothetical protein
LATVRERVNSARKEETSARQALIEAWMEKAEKGKEGPEAITPRGR